jgi:flavoprotein
VPTDQQEFIETTLLCRVDRNVCKLCNPCPAIDVCPQNAIQVRDVFPNINLTLCRNCGLCISACPFGAIKYGEKVKLQIRKIDLENIKRLKKMEMVTVLDQPRQLEYIIRKLYI